MGLDIRVPIGLLFVILGALLALFGVFSDRILYERSLGIDINLWWGLVMLAFGIVMFLAGRRGAPPARGTDEPVTPRAHH